jgi:GTP-binding protein
MVHRYLLDKSMKITSVTFDLSAKDLKSCPNDDLAEFAFIGRSNVGKSSLLNMLAGRANAAKVSATPGSTCMMNFFTVNESWRLVDLPGYGFAKVARANQEKFSDSFADYIVNRPNLYCVFALIDSRHPPQKIDLEFIHWLSSNGVTFVLVFTKTDKSKAKIVQTNIDLFKQSLSTWLQPLPEIFTSSSETKSGLSELLEFIRKTLTSERR